ncbi:putative PurR-regulated permease PerM [Keratinibaculum paraultunense]|uniref:Putative PurR-regulated permease PerM n=1 Tax=Keratinibaculum paraultunense TaxID=1278232 RepID=A0A4R3L135_9FIRM|nr:AI-2E family transporter [Keratinibaculum paraultunense]QQY80561.1 AI-2E family transporter [Keratinibaculum paraultunense]TCS91287.1 putative PurR-regulated permease PerM [Keratinibaculum paraultunense]
MNIIHSDALTKLLMLLTCILVILIIYYLIQIGNNHVDKEKEIHINKKIIFPLLIIILFIYLLYIFIKKYDFLSDIIFTILISLIFAYLLNPLVNYFEKHNIKRSWGIFIIYGIIVGIILIFSFLVIPKTVKELKRLISVLPIYFERISYILNELYINIDNISSVFNGIEEIFIDSINNIQNVIVTSINKFIEGIVSTFSKIISLILIPILTFYFIKDNEYFKNKIYLTIPKKYRKKTEALFCEINLVLSQFVRGRLLLAMYVGLVTTIMLLILKVDFAVIIGVITGVADIIPYIGPFLGFLPAVFFALLDSPIKALWVGILFILIQWVENNILAPKIIGESTGIHPITILLALIIGGGMFGVIGMIFSIPIIAIWNILFDFIIENVKKPNNIK